MYGVGLYVRDDERITRMLLLWMKVLLELPLLLAGVKLLAVYRRADRLSLLVVVVVVDPKKKKLLQRCDAMRTRPLLVFLVRPPPPHRSRPARQCPERKVRGSSHSAGGCHVLREREKKSSEAGIAKGHSLDGTSKCFVRVQQRCEQCIAECLGSGFCSGTISML